MARKTRTEREWIGRVHDAFNGLIHIPGRLEYLLLGQAIVGA
jgi:hypothetical protein